MMWKEPARLSDGESTTAALLAGYARGTGADGGDDGAAWRRLQPPLDARVRGRTMWAHTRLLAGALTLAFGLFVLARSATLAPRTAGAGREASNEGAPGSGGAAGAVDGDSRGAGGMEGAGGGVRRACDGV